MQTAGQAKKLAKNPPASFDRLNKTKETVPRTEVLGQPQIIILIYFCIIVKS